MVVGTVLDKKLYQAFDVLDYALLSAPGAPLKQALIDAGIGMDIGGGYDNSTLQPVFSVIAKNANQEQKEQFLQVIRETLQAQVADGIDQNALLAGINSSEFRFREADFGQFPKGLLYGIQCLDSWLFDDMQPFMHLEALDTYQFLKDQIGTGYYEELVKTYLAGQSACVGSDYGAGAGAGRKERCRAGEEAGRIQSGIVQGRAKEADRRHEALKAVSGRAVAEGRLREDSTPYESGSEKRDGAAS